MVIVATLLALFLYLERVSLEEKQKKQKCLCVQGNEVCKTMHIFQGSDQNSLLPNRLFGNIHPLGFPGGSVSKKLLAMLETAE